MGYYSIKGIGTADVSKKSVQASFSISSSEFFDRYSQYLDILSSKAKSALGDAIDSGSAKHKQQSEIEDFLSRVETSAASAAVAGSSSSTASESNVSSGDQVSSADDAEGEKVPIKVVETLEAKYPFDYLTEKEEEEELADGYGILTRDGKITVKNVSGDQRIWDISAKLVNLDNVEELKEDLYIKELNADSEHEIDYKLKAEKKPAVQVEEFISTSNDPETRSYTLIMDQENVVYYKILIKNVEDFDIKNVVVKKTLFEGYADLDVRRSSAGSNSTDEGKLVWEIEEIPAGGEEAIEFTLAVTISDKEEKVRSGNVEVVYDAADSLSGVELEDFEAYGDNMVEIYDEQQDDNPDVYTGQLEFENLSPYVTKLKKVLVHEELKGEDVLSLEADDVYISTGGRWASEPWELDTQGEDPYYQKTAEFILLAELESTTTTSIEIEDLELAVAIFEAKITYDIETIASHREVPFNATHELENGGAAPFDYISIKQELQNKFKPPAEDELKLSIDGKEYELDSDWVTISGNEIFVELDDMREKDMGMLEPGQHMTLVYPIIADNLDADETFVTNAEWTANTYPRGEPIVLREEGDEAVTIMVVHQRLRVRKGKSVLATATEGVYEIVLQVTNTGNYDLTDYQIRDAVPDGYDAKEISLDPADHSEHDGKEVIIWKLESIAVDEKVEIRYEIHPTKDEAQASGAQFSM